AFSGALDSASPEHPNHHKIVAYLSLRIAEEMGLSPVEKSNLLSASLIHDAGLLLVLSEELRRQGFTPEMARIILYHHASWEDVKDPNKNYVLKAIMKFTSEEVPFSSFILHLADIVAISLDPYRFVLQQVEEINRRIKETAGKKLPREVVEAFLKISTKEHIWLELFSHHLNSYVYNFFPPPVSILNTRDVLSFAELICDFIDFKSLFTAVHSRGVTETAEILARFFQFSDTEREMIKIAGYLHDLGKLAIPVELLEKQDKLDEEEFQLMKAHAFYTYEILSDIKGFETIREWAALHHERLDGSGYPFHLKGEDLSLGARIMAVADVFSALREKRPYRRVMGKKRYRKNSPKTRGRRQIG
ncbi:MAG: HD-GYP domain-containing protein, partial [bacterium]